MSAPRKNDGDKPLGVIIHDAHAKDVDHPPRLLGYVRKRAARVDPLQARCSCSSSWQARPEPEHGL